MDKNTLVGFILIGAVIVGFGIYNRPSQEEWSGYRGIRYLQPPQPGRKSTRTALSGLYPTGYQTTTGSSGKAGCCSH